MTVLTNLTQEEITNIFFSKINMLGFFTKNDNYFFSDGHKGKYSGDHDKNSQIVRSHFYLDPDVKDGVDATDYEDNIIKFAQDTNAFGVLKTGTSYHVEYLFDKTINVKYFKKHFQNYINKLYSIMSEYIDEKYFTFDSKSCSICALDRAPLHINPTTGEKVIWVWYDIDNTIKVSDVIGYTVLDKTSFDNFQIDSKKISILKENKSLKLINSKSDIFSEQYFKNVVNTISKNMYGTIQNLDKSFLCVLHEEKQPSAQFQVVNGTVRYSDFHNSTSVSKDFLSFIYSYLTGQDVVVDSDSYGIYFHNYIDIMEIKILSSKDKIAKINECFSMLYGYMGKKYKPLKRVLEAIKAVAIDNENHGSDCFMASERFISEIAVLDISDTNKLMNLLVAVNFLKRKAVVECNIFNKTYSTPISIDEYDYDEKRLITYVYELNLAIDPEKVVNTIQVFLSKYSISQISKFKLIDFFGNFVKKIILGINRVAIHSSSKNLSEKMDPLKIDQIHMFNINNVSMFTNSYYKLLKIN